MSWPSTPCLAPGTGKAESGATPQLTEQVATHRDRIAVRCDLLGVLRWSARRVSGTGYSDAALGSERTAAATSSALSRASLPSGR